jgi:hypothetical protein
MGDLALSATGRSVVLVSHRRDCLSGFDRVIDLSLPSQDLATGNADRPWPR